MTTSITSHGEPVRFAALDGTPLAATLFTPDDTPHTALLLNSGTSIPQWFTLGLWKLYLPFVSPLYGYARVKKIRWGEDLPVGVAREWGAWCLEPDYLGAYLDESGRHAPLDGEPFGPVHFDDATFPIRAYCFTDDPIATRANVPPMLSLYERAEVETRWVSPQSLGVPGIGHIGFFRSDIGAALWDDALDWLRAQ